MTNDRTIHAEAYEFAIGGETPDAQTHVALHAVEPDGTRTTVAMPVRDAEMVGRMLVSHADYIAGRPPRDW